MKKVTSETFANITKPLKEEAQKAGLKEKEAGKKRKKRKITVDTNVLV